MELSLNTCSLVWWTLGVIYRRCQNVALAKNALILFLLQKNVAKVRKELEFLSMQNRDRGFPAQIQTCYPLSLAGIICLLFDIFYRSLVTVSFYCTVKLNLRTQELPRIGSYMGNPIVLPKYLASQCYCVYFFIKKTALLITLIRIWCDFADQDLDPPGQ